MSEEDKKPWADAHAAELRKHEAEMKAYNALPSQNVQEDCVKPKKAMTMFMCYVSQNSKRLMKEHGLKTIAPAVKICGE